MNPSSSGSSLPPSSPPHANPNDVESRLRAWGDRQAAASVQPIPSAVLEAVRAQCAVDASQTLPARRARLEQAHRRWRRTAWISSVLAVVLIGAVLLAFQHGRTPGAASTPTRGPAAEPIVAQDTPKADRAEIEPLAPDPSPSYVTVSLAHLHRRVQDRGLEAALAEAPAPRRSVRESVLTARGVPVMVP